MPVQVNYLLDGIIVELLAFGLVTGKEIIDANEQIYSEANLHKMKYKVIDRSGCEKYQVSSEDIQTIAKQDKAASKTNSNITVVFVSTTDLQFGITRMWEAYVEGSGFQSIMFKDRSSADEWVQSQMDDTADSENSNLL